MATKDLEVLTFAPVIIPTLCRYDHFKTCLESLMRCTHADKTDVYIGLDYPAKDEHWEGYKKIKNYLNKIHNINKFKSLNVIIRENNYGIGPTGNISSLFKEVLKKYDKLIFSEDDNVFSPAFLDYINKGLEKFKGDKSVLAINGYRHFFNFKCADKDTVFLQNYNFSAWGYGIWKDRYEENRKLSSSWLKSKGVLKSSYKIVKNYGWGRLLDYLSRINTPEDRFRIIDIVLTLYMILEKKYVVTPTISLVRNLGIDGSGENFKNVSIDEKRSYSTQSIYVDKEYPIVKNGPDYFKYNNTEFKNNSISKKSFFQFICVAFKALLNKATKKTIKVCQKFLR